MLKIVTESVSIFFDSITIAVRKIMKISFEINLQSWILTNMLIYAWSIQERQLQIVSCVATEPQNLYCRSEESPTAEVNNC